MAFKFKKIGTVLKVSFKAWWARDPFRESAVIAYYAIFSIPGLLVVVITIAGYFFSEESVSDRLSSQISSTMGKDTAAQIQDIIKTASNSKNSIWATIIGVITILVGATGVFAQFQKSLNMIWEVKIDESKSGVWRLIRLRLFSFGAVVAIAFILMVSLIVSAVLGAFGDWLSSQFSDSLLIVVQIINWIISSLIMVVLFAVMFKVFPDAKIKWRHVWPGSIVTAFLFILGINGMSLYFGKAEPGSGYGAAGSLILILLWVSFSSMIVFLGAEFTRAYAVSQDGHIPSDKNAIKHTKT